jgi:hypothetical protein
LVLGVALGIAAVTAAPVAVSADTLQAQVPPPAQSGGYVTTTTSHVPSLDVSAFSPECVRDAPYINYAIVPLGFTPADGTATLVIRTADGTVVDTTQVTSLTGQLIWPGAQVDAAGNATDWPGWKLADDGVSWIPDPTDAAFREGLTIEVSVDAADGKTVTATATVTYPPETSPCANPPRRDPLADTGGAPGNLLLVGVTALLAGILLVASARRRRDGISSPTG